MPRRSPLSPPWRTVCALLGALLLAATTLTGCTGGEPARTGETGDVRGSDPGAPRGGDPDAARAPLATKASLGKVVGRVPTRTRRAALRRARGVVDGWIDAAYVAGEWPRTEFRGAFADFTAGARKQARGELRLTTNAGIGGRVESVRATRRRVTFDVLAAGKRVVGMTARVGLAYRTRGAVERAVTVRGRMFLTPTRDGWRVFGYDLAKGSRR